MREAFCLSLEESQRSLNPKETLAGSLSFQVIPFHLHSKRPQFRLRDGGGLLRHATHRRQRRLQRARPREFHEEGEARRVRPLLCRRRRHGPSK